MVLKQKELDELNEEISGPWSTRLLIYPFPLIMTLFYIKKFNPTQYQGWLRKLTRISEWAGWYWETRRDGKLFLLRNNSTLISELIWYSYESILNALPAPKSRWGTCSIQESCLAPIFPYRRSIKHVGRVPNNSDWLRRRFCKRSPSSNTWSSGNQVLDSTGQRGWNPARLQIVMLPIAFFV